jgi:sugar phosphate permease
MPQSGSRQLKRKQCVAIALCVLVGAIAYMDRVTLSIGAVEIRKELGLNATAIGGLLSAWSLGYTIAQLPVGMLVDRVRPRKLLALGLLIWSVAQTMGGFVTGYGQFLVSRVLVGVGESPQYPTSVRVTSDWFNVTKRGLPIGINTTAGSLGSAIAPLGLTLLMLAFGWRIMFVAMGVLGILTALIWYTTYKDPEQAGLDPADSAYLQENEPPAGKVTVRQWAKLFSFRSTWGLVLGTLCLNYTNTIYKVWLPGVLEIQYHLSILRTGIYTTFPMIAGMAGALAGGYASDVMAARAGTPMHGRKIVTILSLLGLALFTLVTMMAQTAQQAVIFMSIAFFFGMAAASGLWALVTAVAPRSCVGSMTSITNFGGYIGGTFSPLIAGIVVDMTGSFKISLLIGAGTAALGAAIYWFVLKTPVETEAYAAGILPAQVS